MKAQQLGLKLPKIVAGMLLTLGLGILGVLGRVVQAQKEESAGSSISANGMYLYGEAPQPEQVGKGYVVFAHQNGKVMGAFYYPFSEFDCFEGSMKGNALNTKSVGVDEPEVVTVNVNLADLYQIRTISDNDHRILSACEEITGVPSKP